MLASVQSVLYAEKIMLICGIVKPHAVGHFEEIFAVLQESGVEVLKTKSILYTTELVEILYDHMSGAARNAIAAELVGNEGIALLISVPSIDSFLEIVGRESDPSKCKSHTIRGTSLDSQKRACIEYAEKKGIEVAQVFVERGESATAANRTELIKALDYCKEHKGEITSFIVWKLDRFARNMTDHYGLQAQLLKFGTTLHSVTEEIISEGPIGKMMEAVLAGYAQFENDIRKQRCEGGMRARIRDGISPWMPPIGYVHSKKRLDRRKLVPDQPDEERFHLIQKGLRLYATGEVTITQLTEKSNEWGLRTRTNKPMRKQLWEQILVNKFYAGVLTDPWINVEHRGLHQAMITSDEFDQIQQVKKGLSNNATNRRLLHNPDFPLRGTVRCTCGMNLTASWQKGRSKKYPYYRCHNTLCSQRSNIHKSDLEDKFYAFLENITPDERFIKMFEAVVLDELKTQKTVAGQEKVNYERQAQRLESQKLQLITMRMNGEISKSEFEDTKSGIENQLTGLRIAKNEAETSESSLEVSISYALQFARDVARQWLDLSDSAKRQRLQKLVLPEGIEYDKNTGTFGTAVLSPVFKLFVDYRDNQSDLVARHGKVPHHIRYPRVVWRPFPIPDRCLTEWSGFQADQGFSEISAERMGMAERYQIVAKVTQERSVRLSLFYFNFCTKSTNFRFSCS
jgi:DNA invertase Pin-like site-specific DNA recombinase